MYLVGVGERYPVRWCRVTCLGFLSQDGKYGKAVFPLLQQRKSLDRTHLLFCPPGRSLIRFGGEVGQTQHVAQCHVISPNTVFLCSVWAHRSCWWADVIDLVVKGTVVLRPKHEVISLGVIRHVFRKNVFHGLWDMTARGNYDKWLCVLVNVCF